MARATEILERELPEAYLELEEMREQVDAIYFSLGGEILQHQSRIKRFCNETPQSQLANAERKITVEYSLGQLQLKLEAIKRLTGRINRRLKTFKHSLIVDAAKAALSPPEFNRVMSHTRRRPIKLPPKHDKDHEP